MRSTPGGSEFDNLDRRAFLAALGSASLMLASGCGGGSKPKTGHASAGVRTARQSTSTPGAVPRTLQQAIRGHVFERGHPGFTAAARVYDPRFDNLLPAAVARPVDAV